MNDLLRTAVRTGGTESDSFPHVCPSEVHGASEKRCIELTIQFAYNRDGCCATKCNSKLRRCSMCLALNRPRQLVNFAVDPVTGFCKEHSDPPKQQSKPKTSAGNQRPPQPAPVEAEAPNAPVPPTPPAQDFGPETPPEAKQQKVRVRRPRKLRTDVVVNEGVVEAALLKVPDLRKRQREQLRLCGLGFDNFDIATQINSTPGAVGVELASVNGTLGIKSLPNLEKRPTLVKVARRVFVCDPDYIAKFGK